MNSHYYDTWIKERGKEFEKIEGKYFGARNVAACELLIRQHYVSKDIKIQYVKLVEVIK
jgi:hypothetical protein